MRMVRDLLAEDYRLHQLMVQPEDVGHAGLRRPRTYIICAHKVRSALLYDPQEMYSAISRAIRRVVNTQPQDYLISTDQARTLQAQQLCRSRRLEYNPAARLPCFGVMVR